MSIGVRVQGKLRLNLLLSDEVEIERCNAIKLCLGCVHYLPGE